MVMITMPLYLWIGKMGVTMLVIIQFTTALCVIVAILLDDTDCYLLDRTPLWQDAEFTVAKDGD